MPDNKQGIAWEIERTGSVHYKSQYDQYYKRTHEKSTDPSDKIIWEVVYLVSKVYDGKKKNYVPSNVLKLTSGEFIILNIRPTNF